MCEDSARLQDEPEIIRKDSGEFKKKEEGRIREKRGSGGWSGELKGGGRIREGSGGDSDEFGMIMSCLDDHPAC